MDPAQNRLLTEDASAVTLWAIETFAEAVGVETDPWRTRNDLQETFGARAEVLQELLSSTLISLAAGAKLSVRPLVVEPSGLDEAPLPLLTCAHGGLAITQRRGAQFFVERREGEPAWLSAEELEAIVGAGPHAWFTAVPSAPLAELGGEGHHATPAQRLWALMHLERDDLKVIVVYAMVVGLLTLAAPVAVQALVTTVAFGTLLQPIVILSLMLLVALSFQATLSALQALAVESVQQRVFVRTALDLAWRLPRVRREECDHGFGPETVNRFFDVITLQKTAATLLTDGIGTGLQIGIGMVVLAFYHPALLVFDLVLLALVFLVVLVPLRRGLKTGIDESYAKYDVAAWLEELARPGGALRSAGGAAFAAARADALTSRYLVARRRHFAVVFGQTIGARGVQAFATASLLGLGGWLVVQQTLTLGQLVAAELIVAAVASGIAKLGKLLDATYDLLTAVDKLGHLVDLPIEDPERGEPVPGQGGVRVQVHGASESGEHGLNLEVSAGSRLAVVGAEGHPLGEWLAGLRVPSRGAVSFNGVETSRARTPTLRENIAFVQRGDFFAGTVLENVTLGRLGVTTGEARAALERVGLLDELRAGPGGLDTKLEHNGAPLTHSQLTRMLVARAVTGSPRLIVVDESLEGLDPLARAQCVGALTRDATSWTLVALVADANVALARGCQRVVTLAELSAVDKSAQGGPS